MSPVVTAWKNQIAHARGQPVDDDAAYWRRKLRNAKDEEHRQSILMQIDYVAWDIGAINVENVGDQPSSDPEAQRFYASATGQLVSFRAMTEYVLGIFLCWLAWYTGDKVKRGTASKIPASHMRKFNGVPR